MSSFNNDNNYLDTKEITDMLFKNNMGFPSTSENLPWFQETNMKYNNYIDGSEILIEEMPSSSDNTGTPGWTSDNVPDAVKNTSVPSTYFNSGGMIEDPNNIVRKYTKLKLQPVPGSSNNAFYILTM